MSRRGTAWNDEFELLCERCGYSIDALPREGNCPECGRAVGASLPEARSGSAWQRAPGLGGWFSTNTHFLRRPRRAMRTMQIEGPRARQLGRSNLAAAALIVSIVPAAFFFVLPRLGFESALVGRLRQETSLTGPILSLGAWACLVALLWLLTAVERLGIRFFGRVHRSRITPTVACAITSHATAGWIAGSVLVSLAFAIGFGLHEHAMRHNVGALRGPFLLAPIWLPTVAALAGLLWFETIVYLGVLCCRFANRPLPSEHARAATGAAEPTRSAPRR